ncbi:hypothetical protein R008_A10256 [Saccharomyces cerevisiae R008]|nr:hypothetical protein R008_A10256 [Saccharomyces cerevisiae R008]
MKDMNSIRYVFFFFSRDIKSCFYKVRSYLNLLLILEAILCPVDSLISLPNGIMVVSEPDSPFSHSNPSRRLFRKVNPSSCLSVLYLDLCCSGLIIAEAGIGG